MSIKSSCSKVGAWSNRDVDRSWWRVAAFTQNSTPQENLRHEQRRRGPQSGKRLVGSSHPAECRIWRRVLLRNRAGFSLHEKQGGGCPPLRQSCLGLRWLFLCPRREWLGRRW